MHTNRFHNLSTKVITKIEIAVCFMILLVMGSCSGEIGGSTGGNGNNIVPNHSFWGTAETIDADNALSNYSPVIAMDNAGTAIAVWRQYDGNSYRIWANRFDGTDWGIAEPIDTENTDDQFAFPQIAMDDSGTAIAVWRQYNDNNYRIWANRFDGADWGIAEPIDVGNVSEIPHGNPQIAMDGTGVAIAVWGEFDGIRHNLWANRFDGTGWGIAELLETENADVGNVSFAMDGTGTAIAVWGQYDGTNSSIWANRFDGTEWAVAELVEVVDYAPTRFQIAMDGTGAAIAVWVGMDSTNYSLWASRFDGTEWGTGELLESDDSYDTFSPHIDMDSTGTAIVVWQQFISGNRSNIWVNRFNGTNWDSAALLETKNGDAEEPQIAMDDTGAGIAVWRQYDGTRDNDYAKYFDGVEWGSAFRIDPNNIGWAGDPQIAMDDTGTGFAVWPQLDDTNNVRIWANKFDK